MLRTAPAPLFLLSRFVRDSGYKVVLTGEGADEVLGGYDIFKEAKVRRFWARQPESVLRPKLLQRLRSEEHTSELQSLMRISYAVFCLKKKKNSTRNTERDICY